MEHAAHLAAIRRDGDAFAAACTDPGLADGLDTAVPSCPGWTVADLVWHLGEVHHFWRTMVSERRDTWEGYEQPLRPAAAGLVAWYRTGLDELVDVLAVADPAHPNWTWAADKTAGFVIRRMAHETAMHRWDAEHAAGIATSIDPELASDGIDEFLMWFAGEPAPDAPAAGGSVHLHCADVAGEWTLRPAGAGGFEITREHAKGDCAIRGTASDILLALWRRIPLAALDVVGDAGVAARFVAAPSLE